MAIASKYIENAQRTYKRFESKSEAENVAKHNFSQRMHKEQEDYEMQSMTLRERRINRTNTKYKINVTVLNLYHYP